MIKSNSFKDIVNDDLEHIVFGIPDWDGRDRPGKPPTVDNLKDLLDYNFSKRQNLVYQNDSFYNLCDFVGTKKQNTDIMTEVLRRHKDKNFMIIDHGRFDHFTLNQYQNCQVWPRKYFAPAYGFANKNLSRDISIIQKQRKTWFCALLGRSNFFRSQMFNWIMDEGLDRQNKVSYLCYEVLTRNITLHTDQQENFIKRGGKKEYQHMIPFNNFENTNDVPADNEGRTTKPVPLYDCLFNIAMEPYPENHSAFLTEKSLNTILYGHVPVIVGGEGSMKKLQDIGMIVPDYLHWPMWDDIPVDEMNFSKIDIVQRQLKSFLSKHSITDISKDWYPYAVRNLLNFNNLESKCAEEEKEIWNWVLSSNHNAINNIKYETDQNKKSKSRD